jgi:hypothetical protein
VYQHVQDGVHRTVTDLVITCDSALAHLAGALAVPVWVALSWLSDWRWLREREDSPWYPSMRLFRQKEPGNWAEVFERIAAQVEKLQDRKRESREKPISSAANGRTP